MVDSSNGGCRCSCQTDLTPSDLDSEGSESRSSCCSPNVFTSVLLGVLACVLVTGGVFLAFHRWDPMWLIVSGIGIILICIGSILHCANNSSQSDSRRQSSSGASKGCRPLPPDHQHHHHHQLTNNGNLTEQLLPLSNARSVSQLSLNMLPGYFPPVVSAYGIEQHSAVVQNINRLVQQQQQQQQQQQHQQQQQAPSGSISPGVVSGNPGKSFILLSLPADTNPASIQNLVATVYQLDGSIASEIPAMDVPSQTATPTTPVSTLPVLKNAEVQTYNIWSTIPASDTATSSNNRISTSTAGTSTDNCQTERSAPVSGVITASSVTQTEDGVGTTIPINLMDCGSDISTVCDSIQNTASCSSAPSNALVSTPGSRSNLLVEVLEPCGILVDVPELSSNIPGSSTSECLTTNSLVGASGSSSDVLISSTNALVDVPIPSRNILVDVSQPVLDPGCSASGRLESSSNELMCATVPLSNDIADSLQHVSQSPSTSTVVNIPEQSLCLLVDVQNEHEHSGPSDTEAHANGTDVVNSGTSSGIQFVCNIESEPSCSRIYRENSATDIIGNLSALEGMNSEFPSSGSCSLSAIDADMDDEDSVGRSSPPPSYEDATNETEETTTTIGAFGLAYGTI